MSALPGAPLRVRVHAGLALAVALAGCGDATRVERGLDEDVAARLAEIRAAGRALSGGTESEVAATQWTAWLVAGEPALVEEVVQIEEWGTTTSLYLFESERLVFHRQTGQRPTSVLGGAGLEEIELELRWAADGAVAGTKRVDRAPVELPAWEEAVARERARDLRALVLEAARAQGATGGSAAGSRAETSS